MGTEERNNLSTPVGYSNHTGNNHEADESKHNESVSIELLFISFICFAAFFPLGVCQKFVFTNVDEALKQAWLFRFVTYSKDLRLICK